MRRPNILILYTDQQRWDALGANGGVYGFGEIQTPSLDRLAQESANFDHCFVQCPVCMPSRVSFLTGQYPATLGILEMGVPVPPVTMILPRLLRNYGYRSANLGKLHFLPHANRDHCETHPDYGFDQLEISDEPGCYEDAYRAWVRHREPEALSSISCGLPPAAMVWNQAMGVEDTVPHPPEGRRDNNARTFAARSDLSHTAFVAERTLDYLDSAARRPDDPFLLIAGFYSPHSPWIAPQEFFDLYDVDTLQLPPHTIWEGRQSEAALRAAVHGYYAMVSEVDRYIGEILKRLETSGQAENTIVVFTSDHGEWLGAQGGKFGKGFPADDSVSRVPLLLRAPGRIPPHRESRIVESLDVLPTLLDLAGIPLPPHLQGKPLFSRPDAVADSTPASALTEMGDWKALRTADFRYLVHSDGRERLHSLKTDPWEMHNLAEEDAGGLQSADVLADHRHLLLQRLLNRERPLARTWPY